MRSTRVRATKRLEGRVFVYGIIMVMTAAFEGQRKGEEVILVFRRHILTSARGFFFCLIWCGLGAIPMILWRDNPQVIWVTLACVIIGAINWLYSFVLWHFSYYLLTNERLRQVRQKGFFKRMVVDLELSKIMSVSYGVPGILGSIFNYGTILVQTAAGDLVLSRVSHPEEVHMELQNAAHTADNMEGDEDED